MDNMQDTVYQLSDQNFYSSAEVSWIWIFSTFSDETQNPIPVSEASADSEESLK